jgi:hypothetical protein
MSQLRDTPESRRTTTPYEIGRIHFPAEVKLTERSYRLALRALGRPRRRAQKPLERQGRNGLFFALKPA